MAVYKLVANNLLSDPPLRNESESRIEFRGNPEQEITAAFVSAKEGNLRLTARAAAIDRAVPLPEVTGDIDRQLRGKKPDIGAHEFRSRHHTQRITRNLFEPILAFPCDVWYNGREWTVGV